KLSGGNSQAADPPSRPSPSGGEGEMQRQMTVFPMPRFFRSPFKRLLRAACKYDHDQKNKP
ncbi:MAG: hypothetical protein R6U50_08430, partial [Desulfobacterales bacterium]